MAWFSSGLERELSGACGGAIISDRHILSAASCIEKLVEGNPKNLFPVFGLMEFVQSGEVYGGHIEHIANHPDYIRTRTRPVPRNGLVINRFHISKWLWAHR